MTKPKWQVGTRYKLPDDTILTLRGMVDQTFLFEGAEGQAAVFKADQQIHTLNLLEPIKAVERYYKVMFASGHMDPINFLEREAAIEHARKLLSQPGNTAMASTLWVIGHVVIFNEDRTATLQQLTPYSLTLKKGKGVDGTNTLDASTIPDDCDDCDCLDGDPDHDVAAEVASPYRKRYPGRWRDSDNG